MNVLAILFRGDEEYHSVRWFLQKEALGVLFWLRKVARKGLWLFGTPKFQSRERRWILRFPRGKSKKYTRWVYILKGFYWFSLVREKTAREGSSCFRHPKLWSRERRRTLLPQIILALDTTRGVYISEGLRVLLMVQEKTEVFRIVPTGRFCWQLLFADRTHDERCFYQKGSNLDTL